MRAKCGKSKGDFLLAAELGHASASNRYAVLLDRSDPRRIVFRGKAAAAWCSPFLKELLHEMTEFGFGSPTRAFAFGRVFRDVSMTKSEQSLIVVSATMSTASPQICFLVSTNFSCSRIEKQSTFGHILAFVTKLSRTFES